MATFNSRAVAITTGICPICGTKLYRTGKSDAHSGLTPPPPAEKPAREKSPADKMKSKAPARSKSAKSAPSSKANTLVIVESPAKARTIGKFLGDDYKVIASVGHVRDLLKSQLSVDVNNNFSPKYRVPNEKSEVVKQIKSLASSCKQVYLATDPDREGESIAWHILDSASIDPAKTERVVFHEITREAVGNAFANPRQIDMDLVDAQQARRILDRLVGYEVSPILWKKVRGRLSAGRVQSMALRLIVEREREIQDFIPVEYWVITALFQPEGSNELYKAKLVKINKEDFSIPSEADCAKTADDMRTAGYTLDKIKKSQRKIHPSAPFITSTLQQEAARKLGFPTRKTMIIAQQLYEGIDIGSGEDQGLITYMRTDSVHLAPQAVNEARAYIQKVYGPSYVPATPPHHVTRAASAQEAHEAIRPTSVNNAPDAIKAHLSNDQYKLYKLIWQRMIASQMSDCLTETTSIEILGQSSNNLYLLRSNSTRTLFPGFRAIYQESVDDDKSEDDEQNSLPINALQEGQTQKLKDLECSQHFTQAPPRYTEASLIQVLEENKIGRPSTYSPIISNIQQRGYVIMEAKRLIPSEIGFLVNDLVVEYFPTIVDIGFTSEMEDKLDQIARGETPWVEVIREFYQPFALSVQHAHANMPENKIEPEKIGRACPKCGGELVLRTGRYGKFISCSKFPECRFTESFLKKIDVPCPKCQEGEVVEKRSKKGRLFYGCSRYPDCDFTSWAKPLATPCPHCGGLLASNNPKHVVCQNCHADFKLEDGKPIK